MNKVSFLTLGCKVNQYETEAMQELFKKRGYEICNENDICDVYVINTCTVTNLSDRKSRQFISRAKKLNKDAILAVVGCYSQVAPDEISAIEDVDVIIGTKNRARIVELCEESKKSNLKFNIVSEFTKDCGFDVLSIENQESKTRAYIKIQEGCNMFCTYCIIPYARGPIKSRPIDDIYEEAVKLTNNGYKEVIITGIHVGSYGLDLGNDIRLIDVIEKLSTIENLDRIRLSSIEAGIISEDFLIRLKNCKKLCEHFHLSLQSGCDKILKLMNRRYTTDMYRKKVRMIKKIFPNVALTTDIIVGFPGETEEDFEDTLSMVEKVGYDQGFTFLYSIRKGTKAAEMQNQIPHEVKQERFQRLIDSMYKIFYEKNKECLGQTLEVLVEGISKNNSDILTGRTRGYKLVHFKGGKRNIGQLVNVKITGHNSFALEGEIV
mgnify:CR=1 FL=1